MLNKLVKQLKAFFTFDCSDEMFKEFKKWINDIYYVQERIADFGSQAFPREMMADYGGPIEYNRPLDENGNKLWNEEPYVWLRWPIDEKDDGVNNSYCGMVFSNQWAINKLVNLGILEKDPNKEDRAGNKIRLTMYGKRFIQPALEELSLFFQGKI